MQLCSDAHSNKNYKNSRVRRRSAEDMILFQLGTKGHTHREQQHSDARGDEALVSLFTFAMISIGTISKSPPADAMPKRTQSCSDSEAL